MKRTWMVPPVPIWRLQARIPTLNRKPTPADELLARNARFVHLLRGPRLRGNQTFSKDFSVCGLNRNRRRPPLSPCAVVRRDADEPRDRNLAQNGTTTLQ